MSSSPCGDSSVCICAAQRSRTDGLSAQRNVQSQIRSNVSPCSEKKSPQRTSTWPAAGDWLECSSALAASHAAGDTSSATTEE